MSTALFADLPTTRRREVISAVAHCIAGVLDQDTMAQIVRAFRGRRLPARRPRQDPARLHARDDSPCADDGRVVWRPTAASELTALPESLVREQAKP